jgi:hypothetical protein
MFGNKNKQKDEGRVVTEKEKTWNFLDGQKKEENLDFNFSIHTMGDDLRNQLNEGGSLGDGAGKSQTENKQSSITPIASKRGEDYSKYGSSPFLEKNVSPNVDLSDSIKTSNVKVDNKVEINKKEEIPQKRAFDFEKKEKNTAGFGPKEDLSIKNSREFESVVATDILNVFKKEDVHPVERHLNWKRVGLIVAVMIIFAAIAGGAYYFFITRQANESQIPNDEFAVNDDMPEIPSEDNFMYSSEKPNYLNLDMETADKNAIFQLVENTFLDIDTKQDGVSIEFILRDTNNNPIAFSRFAYIFGISLPETVQSEMEEDFSVFLIKNGDSKRMGLAIDIRDANILPFVMKEGEKSLVNDVKSLFLGKEIQVAQGAVFGDSTYGNGVNIRYVNIDMASGDSVDYAVWNNMLLVGTSKDSLRNIFDKLSSGENSDQVVDIDNGEDEIGETENIEEERMEDE